MHQTSVIFFVFLTDVNYIRIKGVDILDKLEETKGTFKVVGFAVGLQNQDAYREGVVDKGANEGKAYRSLRFGVRVSPTNLINVELYGVEKDSVYPYNNNKKESIEIPWEDRFNPPAGYKVIGVNMNLVDKREMMVEYDAIEHIYNSLKDGDSVYVSGNIQWQEFLTRNGDEVVASKYAIRAIYKTKTPVEFDAEDFVPTNDFEQTIVVTDVIKEEETLLVNAYVVGYSTYYATQFVIDITKQKGLAKKFTKFKFGDQVKVFGKIINETEVIKEEIDDDDDWGDMPESYKGKITNTNREMLITRADPDSYEKKKYDVKDFYNKDKEFAADDDDDDDWGDGDTKDDTDDDLPF